MHSIKGNWKNWPSILNLFICLPKQYTVKDKSILDTFQSKLVVKIPDLSEPVKNYIFHRFSGVVCNKHPHNNYDQRIYILKMLIWQRKMQLRWGDHWSFISIPCFRIQDIHNKAAQQEKYIDAKKAVEKEYWKYQSHCVTDPTPLKQPVKDKLYLKIIFSPTFKTHVI